MINPPRPLDKFYATLILNILTKPFETQKAFDLGIIDKQGNQIKKPENEQERDAYNPLYQVAFGVKKIIDSFPGTKNNIRQLAVSMNFIRQQVIPKQFNESVDYNMFLKEMALVIDNDLVLAEEEVLITQYMSEEGEAAAPTTTTSSGAPENSTDNIDIHTPVINKMFRRKPKKDELSNE